MNVPTEYFKNLFSLKKTFPLAIIASLIIWFSMLGHRDLVDPDEARYSEIPREMVESGDWLTPRLNGFKYFEKPALQYWLTAISFKMFGESSTSARLWLALAGYLCAVFVGFVGCRVYGTDIGVSTYFITLSGFVFFAMGHVLTLDMTLCFFMSVGVGAFILSQVYREEKIVNRNWMMLGWAALAAAVLTKGLVGFVLPAGAICFYMLWQRDWNILLHLHLFKGVMLFLLLTAPWFIWVSIENKEFANFFFIHEHLERYTTTVHKRGGPLYYFIPILVLGAFPWLIASLKSLATPEFKWKVKNESGFNMERFLWTYIVTIFVFFSISSSKLPAYILPIFPFIAMLTAKRLILLKNIKADLWTSVVFSLVIFLIVIFADHFASKKYPLAVIEEYRPWLIVSSICFVLSAIAIKLLAKYPRNAIAVVSIFSLLGFQMILQGYNSIGKTRSAVNEAKAIQSAVPDTANVYAVNAYPQALPFYLKKTIKLVHAKSELEMGIDAEPEKWIATEADFISRWMNEESAAAIMKHDVYHRLKETGVPMSVIYTSIRWVVVKRR